jgi:Kelch motif
VVAHSGRKRRICIVGVAGALSLGALGAAPARAAVTSYFTGIGVGAMSAPRQNPVAAPLPDGTVLIAGGYTTGGAVSASAELYNPATGAFSGSGLGAMTSPRSAAVSAPLRDGRVLIAGGATGSAITPSAEVYQPATGTFTAVGSMSVARDGAAAAPLPDGKVLIVGGYDGSNVFSSAEVFNPASGQFTLLAASMRTPRWFPVAAPLPNGEVLITGGIAPGKSNAPLASAELYNPATHRFSSAGLGSMTIGREAPIAAPLPDGKVLIAGGNNASGTTLSSAEEFNPATGTFSATRIGPMTTARFGAGAATLPTGQVLIAGGGNPGQSSRLQSAELFDPAPEVAAASASFGNQGLGAASPVQSLVITNVGVQALTISGAAVGGADPGDFAIPVNACAGRRLAYEQSCTVSVDFTPSAVGARTATLMLNDNEPPGRPAIQLSGTGVGTGVGNPGAIGPAGTIELISCRTVTVMGSTHRRRRCSTRTVPSTATFTSTPARATLVRGGVVFATGTARLTRLVLHTRRRVRPGVYTLILKRRSGRHTITIRRKITIA